MSKKVKVFKDFKKTEFSYVGYLLTWSTHYEELQQGIGQYPVAIIAAEDGNVFLEPPQCIQFIKEEQY